MDEVKTELIPLDWNQAHAGRYLETIARKIPGYSLIYGMAEQLITAHLGDGYGETHLMVVGAGGGEEIVRFGCEHEDWYFQGVDPSSSMLEMTRQRVEQNRMSNRVALLQGTVHELAQGMVYDAASCLLVLHFVEELAQKRELLLQIATRLKPGAPLVLALISGDAGSAAFRIQMEAWRKHMRSNGIPEEEWECFSQSMGNDSHPVPDYVLRELLQAAGFQEVTRYFGAFLVEGWFAVKA